MLTNTALNTPLPNATNLPCILRQVVQRIAPNWPLDQMIAVNPYWEMRDQSIEAVAAALQTVADARLLMPGHYYAEQFSQGQISALSIEQALREYQEPVDVSRFVLRSQSWQSSHAGIKTLAHFYDEVTSPHALSWEQEINSHISQFCALFFQQQQETPIELADGSLYQQYCEFTAQDRGLDLLLAAKGLHQRFAQLPHAVEDVLALYQHSFELNDAAWEGYALALQMQLNGWSSWVAYLNWQAKLNGMPARLLLDLVTIKLSWEWVLLRHLQQHSPITADDLLDKLRKELELTQARNELMLQQQKMNFIWLRAVEIGYQQNLLSRIQRGSDAATQPPTLQAAFCIDVRSEVFRRHLEAQQQDIQTLGFAGFFGLPITLQISQTGLSRPQLPGLLKPVLTATPLLNQKDMLRKGQHRGHWLRWGRQPGASFSMVESSGWLALPKLVQQTLWPKRQQRVFEQASQTEQWSLQQAGVELTVDEKAALAQKVLHLMDMTHFAPTVLLVGHAGESNNNLHAACLDCGACGGQSGEVNVRVLASLLNDQAVRAAMARQGLPIPSTTTFVAALHNTTTDQVHCFAPVPDAVTEWLRHASQQSVLERQKQQQFTAAMTNAAVREQTRKALDWSETRPEWGLANNAAFIIAPRAWTRGVDLKGRVFLHDYSQANDTDLSTLELLLTAPMVVTHWINMQYNASVTDPLKFGSGNKVLHNAVAEHIGVFEGQGGDLRIGLPLQSVHDGQHWMHQPQRLTVVVAASCQSITEIISKHPDLLALVNNGWLYLWQWQQGAAMKQWQQGQWLEVQMLEVQKQEVP